MKKLFFTLIVLLVSLTLVAHTTKSEKVVEDQSLTIENLNPDDSISIQPIMLIAEKQELNIKKTDSIQDTDDDPDDEDLKAVTIRANVIYIEEGIAKVFTTHHSKIFEFSDVPEINPYKNVMHPSKEYFFRLEYSEQDREENHCSGCSGTVRARLIWFSVTPTQAKKDSMELYDIETGSQASGGYDRSPRY